MKPNLRRSTRPLHAVFRVDAGKRHGSGHFMRCMVLWRELLARGHTVDLIIQHLPAHLAPLIEDSGIAVHTIETDCEAIAQLAALHQKRPVDWLVVDHYGLDASWESAARRWASRILVIDDLADRPHDCDLLLDQNVPNSLQQRYTDLVPRGCVQAIGWSYLLARAGFYAREVQARSGTLVFLGGGDHSVALSDLLSQLVHRHEWYPLEVLVSSDYSATADWQVLLAGRGGLYSNLPEPAPLYRKTAMAIVRCGFVSYELALLGIPAVNIHAGGVHAEVAMTLERLGLGVALPQGDLSDPDLVTGSLQRAAELAPTPLNLQLAPGAGRVADLLEHRHEQR